MRCDMRREFEKMVGEFEVKFKDRLKCNEKGDEVDESSLLDSIQAHQAVGFQGDERIGHEETVFHNGRKFLVQRMSYIVLTAKEVYL